MGITIHYAFIRRNAPEALLKRVAGKARALGMRIEHLSPTHLVIDPHPQSEWIDLHWRQWKLVKSDSAECGEKEADELKWAKEVFSMYYPRSVHDEDWVCLGFTKTQFAGVECHCAVAELLRLVAAYCRLADVSDEADYYEWGPAGCENAKRAFDASAKAISQLAARLKEQFGAENVFCGQDAAAEF